jgi:hypothetical protein
MAEAIQENLATGHESRTPRAEFESEILAFCCEH